MNRIISWFIVNPVASNLLMVVLVLGGLMALPIIHQEEFPSVDVNVVRVSVEYAGATPDETEESICIKIEEEIESVPEIDRIQSLAVEGACVVSVETLASADIDSVLAEVQNRVDAIDTFPEDCAPDVAGAYFCFV